MSHIGINTKLVMFLKDVAEADEQGSLRSKSLFRKVAEANGYNKLSTNIIGNKKWLLTARFKRF